MERRNVALTWYATSRVDVRTTRADAPHEQISPPPSISTSATRDGLPAYALLIPIIVHPVTRYSASISRSNRRGNASFRRLRLRQWARPDASQQANAVSKAGSVNGYTFLLSSQISWRDRYSGWKNVASVPTSPAIRRRSERIGRFPKALILGDPCIRFSFGGKARGDLWQSAGPDHLHGEAVIVSSDHAVIRGGHGCPSQVNAHVRVAVMSEGASCNARSNLRRRFDCGRVR